jgi:hypothetical protein
MIDVQYGARAEIAPAEVADFYRRLNHQLAARPEQIRKMLKNSAALVTARVDGRLIGLARGVSDGVRGYLTECKLDPEFQGPGCVTRTDGRVEHDTHGIARELASRVLETLFADGVQRVDTVAYGTELDFCEELGFKRNGGLVGVTLVAHDWAGAAKPVA